MIIRNYTKDKFSLSDTIKKVKQKNDGEWLSG
jgi:hypothetical protein